MLWFIRRSIESIGSVKAGSQLTVRDQWVVVVYFGPDIARRENENTYGSYADRSTTPEHYFSLYG